MYWLRRSALSGLVCLLFAVPTGWAQSTTLRGSLLALRSSLTASPDDPFSFLLAANGYIGTYVTLGAPASVTFSLNAAGSTTDGTLPRMNLAVADSFTGWDVGNGFNNYSTTIDLPAGTHFVRTEFANDVPTADRKVTVHSLQVDNATVSNVDSSANALAAADTYIANYRKGNATLHLQGVAAGTPVTVDLTRHAFNFGGAIAVGTNTLNNNVTFQNFINKHFNMLVPANAGKWGSQEFFRDGVNTAGADAVFNYAAAHGMRARQHNLLWATQQPGWVNTLLTDAGNGNAAAANDLRGEISERIDYYVGDGPGGFAEQAPKYLEVDVYNESVHTGVQATGNNNYWDIYGPSGIASIYNEVNQAIAASGSQARAYVNEYNVLQFGGDQYGAWYLRHIEDIENGDGDPTNHTVGGIGMQYYALSGHSASAMQKVLQNMSVFDGPLSLTEFGVQVSVAPDSPAARQMLTESMRMMFGTRDATSFLIWGWAANATSDLQSSSVLVQGDLQTLTNVGKDYQDLLGIQDWDGNPDNGWHTTVDAVVGPDGTINFDGFYGDYKAIIHGSEYLFTLNKGESSYFITVPEPATALTMGLALATIVLIRGQTRPIEV